MQYRKIPQKIWYQEDKSKPFRDLDSNIFSRHIVCYNVLTEKERIKQVNIFLNKCKVVKKVNIPFLDIEECPFDNLSDLSEGTQSLLSTARLFEDQSVGYRLLAIELSAMRCESLREQMTDFRPVLFIRTQENSVIEILKQWIISTEPKEHWKYNKAKIHRTPILDYRNPSIVGRQLLDFNRATIRIKKGEKVRAPIPYDDIAIMAVGAEISALHELETYIEYAGLILIHSAKGKYEGSTITPKQVSSFDPILYENITSSSNQMAAVLSQWRCSAEDENAWAKQIADAAKSSFGKPDSRYRSVTFDPVKLADAVYLEVCRSFADYAVAEGWIDAETADQWFAGAVEVFSPKSSEAPRLSRMEDPEAFLQIVKNRYPNFERIAAANEPFSSKQENEGAIREISGIEYLVFPEDWLKKVYLKEAKRAKYDCTLSERSDWMRNMQGQLCNAGVLKWDRKNPRFRYDLYRNGSRDSTYVLAIPLEKLK